MLRAKSSILLLVLVLLSALALMPGCVFFPESEDETVKADHSDYVAPKLEIETPDGPLRGGQTVNVAFTASDESGLASAVLYYAEDGMHFSEATSTTSVGATIEWQVPQDTDSTLAKVRIIVADRAGNKTSDTSDAFTIDSTPPDAPSASALGSLIGGHEVGITLDDCDDKAMIYVNEGDAPESDAEEWQTCSTNADAITGTVAYDGAHTLHVWSKDEAGNVSTTYGSVSATVDGTAPVVTLASLTGGQAIVGGVPVTISWTATDTHFGANPIDVEYSSDGGSTWNAIAGPTANDGSESWTPPAANSLTYRVRVKATDQGGNVAYAASSSNFSVDSTSPTLAIGQMSVGGSTSNPYASVDLKAADNLTKITHFCLKNSTGVAPAAPASSDACWVSVAAPKPGLSAATTLTLDDFPWLLGFSSATYAVYAWVRDEAGNVSTMSQTSGKDVASRAYASNAAPLVSAVIAANTDSPSSPIASGELSVASGGDVYVKWSASDVEGLAATPISLYYTTDDSTWTLAQSGLSNGVNGSCTLGAYSGCYQWTGGAPSSSFFRVRVVAVDSGSLTAQGESEGMNAAMLRVLAGDTARGIGAAAARATFMSERSSPWLSDPGSFVVTEGGVAYFRDTAKGIFKIDPSTGLLTLLIPTTGTSAGDGGAASSATLKSPLRIALDSKERLLVFDYDRIRRIDTRLTTPIIQTVVGGGSSTSATVAPLSLSITPPASAGAYDDLSAKRMPFIPLPDGHLYFQSEGYGDSASATPRIRLWKPESNEVSSLTISGTGEATNATQDISKCALRDLSLLFDYATGAVSAMQVVVSHEGYTGCTASDTHLRASLSPATAVSASPHPASASSYEAAAFPVQARNGGIYVLSRKDASLFKWDSATSSWSTVLGTGTVGTCADGTLATACAIDPQDAFVSMIGQVYFIDRGRVRAIDSSGQVVTLYGASLSGGDGSAATQARFNAIRSIDERASGAIVALDPQEARFREFSPGGSIATIAGDGSQATPTTAAAASGQSVLASASSQYWDDFIEDPTTGNLYFNRGASKIAVLDRGTGRWADLVGGGATTYSSADGLLGTSISIPAYPARLLGFDGANVLSALLSLSGSAAADAMLKLHAMTDGTQAHGLGTTGAPASSLCLDGVLASSCAIPSSYAENYARAAYDSIGSRWLLLQVGTQAVRTLSVGGAVGTLTTLAQAAQSFTYASDVVYYCGASDGMLHKKDILASTDTAYSWPIASMSCTGRTLLYDSSRGSLVFPFKRDGAYGIGELTSP